MSSTLQFSSSGTEFCMLGSGSIGVFGINFCSGLGVLIGLLSCGVFTTFGETSIL